MTSDRPTSWVSNEADRDERIRHVQGLVGLSISAVRYFDIDYKRIDLGIETAGPRSISDPAEWVSPSWREDVADCIAFGLELETSVGRVFSIAWDPPGLIEGIGMREEPLLGGALKSDGNFAVWDVGERSRWQGYLGKVVSSLTMHYAPWGDGSDAWWCDRITILMGSSVIEILLATVAFDTKAVAKSADDVVVLFDPTELPDWVNS